MTRSEIIAFFPAGLPIKFGGNDYAVPTLAWLQGPFYSAFKGELWSQDLDRWAVKWECRDFARGMAYEAQKAHALTPVSPDGEPCIAVGELWFTPDAGHYGLNTELPRSGHAICACFADQGLIYIDPQNGLKWELTASELISVSLLRF